MSVVQKAPKIHINLNFDYWRINIQFAYYIILVIGLNALFFAWKCLTKCWPVATTTANETNRHSNNRQTANEIIKRTLWMKCLVLVFLSRVNLITWGIFNLSKKIKNLLRIGKKEQRNKVMNRNGALKLNFILYHKMGWIRVYNIDHSVHRSWKGLLIDIQYYDDLPTFPWKV